MADAQKPPRIALRISDTDWLGWTAADITLTMDAVAGAFTIGLTDRWPGSTSYRPISPGERCILSLDDEPVITGYVDVVMPFYTASEHSINISGRDATGDLVDCSAQSGEWRGLKVEELVGQIAAPFGIPVVTQVDTGTPIEKFRIQEGEAAWAAIDRAAKERAVIGMSDGQGNIVLTRATTAGETVPLILGGPDGNVLKGTGVFQANEQYSAYVIKAQRGGLVGSPEDRAHVVAQAEDRTVGRPRTLVIVARDSMDPATAQAQAQWEANSRRGKAIRVSYTVAGWRDPSGKIWRANRIVRVKDEWLSVDRELIVATVRLTVSEDGVLTDLDLADPAAYLPEPPKAEPLPKSKTPKITKAAGKAGTQEETFGW